MVYLWLLLVYVSAAAGGDDDDDAAADAVDYCDGMFDCDAFDYLNDFAVGAAVDVVVVALYGR